MMLSLFGDAVVAALLVATISYAAVLNRRLSVLRGDRVKLEELVQGLTVAAQRAEAGVTGLREAAEDVGRGLERKIEQAKSLRDDLTYMLDRGTGIADRLEGTIRARRSAEPEKREAKADSPPSGEPRAVPPADGVRLGPAAPSRAERELLRALAGR
jgi:glutamine synthetase type III